MLVTLTLAIAILGLLLVAILFRRSTELDATLKDRKHKSMNPGVADLLPWAAEVDDGIIVCKNGSFCSAFIYAPKDSDYETPDEKELRSFYLNEAFKSLGNGWMVHVDAVRRQSPGYPEPNRSFFPDRVSRAIDEERRRFFASKDLMYESYFIITITWKPPMLVAQRLVEYMFDDDRAKPNRTKRTEELIETYKKGLRGIQDRLTLAFPHMAQLKTRHAVDEDGKDICYDDFLSWLHFCVTGLNHKIQLPPVAMYLDRVIGGQDFWAGTTPKIGKKFISTVSIEGFPSASIPGILNQLSTLGVEYRWSTRFICMDTMTAENHIDKYRRHWAQKVRGFFDQIFNRSNGRINVDAAAMVEECDHMKSGVTGGYFSAGYYTSVIVLMDESRDKLDTASRTALKLIQKLGFAGRIEELNCVEAWLGSLPGNGIANVRRPLITTQNLGDLLPTSGIWTGEESAPCPFYPPDSPALMQCVTTGATPFRLNLHVGDVGHTVILGPTGSGKSTLLGTIAVQALRYQDMTIFSFDKGRSMKCLCEAVGGQHYEIGGQVTIGSRGKDTSSNLKEVEALHEQKSLNFAPLHDIKLETERAWAQSWIEDLLTLNGIDLTPARRNKISDALMATAKSNRQTLSFFRTAIQDAEIKEVLDQYVSDDNRQGLLDADEDGISECNFSCFELDELMSHGEKTVLPVLLYLFHRIERSLHGQPALIILDEAWTMLGHKIFREKIREWLKTLRRANCSVVMATQSISDLIKSGIADVITESCPTKIFLPNPRANQEGSVELYKAMGLNACQIDIIRQARPKREYYVASPIGHRLFNLALGPLALAIIGASERETLEHIQMLKNIHGPAWVDFYLSEKNLNLKDYEDALQH